MNYIWETKNLADYGATRNQLSGANFSSKLSPWFAVGALSPRSAYFMARSFEEKHGHKDSVKAFTNELFWRDFHRFWCLRHGYKIFTPHGVYNRTQYKWKTNEKIIQRWKQGLTGMPLIDALMRDLNATGFMSNRGRQIVACYLALDLGQDWRHGAYHFEEKLIDHDVQSNYGGWNSAAGIGPGRVYQFNVLKNSFEFDPNGDYIRTWVPELENVPTKYIHKPWTMPYPIQTSSGVIVGTNYPQPIPCDKYTNNSKY